MNEFLKESWERTAEHERTSREQEFINLYFDVKEKSERDPVLKPLMDQLDKSIAEYVSVVIENKKAWRAQQPDAANRSAQEGSDRRQQNLHNVLIDSLNQLSRAWRNQGLKNTWRRDLGENRDVIADWAIFVATTTMGMEMPN